MDIHLGCPAGDRGGGFQSVAGSIAGAGDRAEGRDLDVARSSAALVAPATLNTITKWAAGHADTLALGLITEALGIPERPVVARPYINAAQAQHSALAPAITTLRTAGVHYLLDDGHGPGFHPHQPKQGNADTYSWSLALDKIRN
ncbi:flavoprotein [Streptomyces sp. NPDC002073]